MEMTKTSREKLNQLADELLDIMPSAERHMPCIFRHDDNRALIGCVVEIKTLEGIINTEEFCTAHFRNILHSTVEIIRELGVSSDVALNFIFEKLKEKFDNLSVARKEIKEATIN